MGSIDVPKKIIEVSAGKFPFEWLGGRLPVVLEVEEPLSNGDKIGEVIRCKNLSLND